MKKIRSYGFVLLTCSLALVACGQKSSSSQEIKKDDKKVQTSSSKKKQEKTSESSQKDEKESKSAEKQIVEATGNVDIQSVMTRQDYSSFAGTWINAAGDQVVFYPDGTLGNGDRLKIGSPYADVAVVALERTGEIVTPFPIGTDTAYGHGGRSDSTKPRIAISKEYQIPTEKYYYRKSDGVTFFDKETKPKTDSAETPDINVDEIKQGNLSSLEGSWVQSSRNIWNIGSNGEISSSGRTTGEIIRLAAEQDDGPGINLELTYRSVATPLILYPKGVVAANSDSSKNRITFADTDNYYFYKQ